MGSPLYFLGLLGLYFPEYAININGHSNVFRVARGINAFMNAIANNGVMASSNNYDISFQFTEGQKVKPLLKKFEVDPSIAGNEAGTPASLINMFCDEANFPSFSAATGQMQNKYQGEGTTNYPHTRLDSDLSLSWMCDANMAPYKFLATWMDFIFGEKPDNSSKFTLENLKSQSLTRDRNQVYRLSYPEDYISTIRLIKVEKGQNAPNGRPSAAVIFENAYPYTIDAIPLSYGTSQLVKVSASFYYSKHHNIFVDNRRLLG